MIRKFKSYEPSIGLRVYVDEQATVIGDVTLGDDCSVWPQTVIRGDIKPINVGARTNIQDGSVVHVTHESNYSVFAAQLIFCHLAPFDNIYVRYYPGSRATNL